MPSGRLTCIASKLLGVLTNIFFAGLVWCLFGEIGTKAKAQSAKQDRRNSFGLIIFGNLAWIFLDFWIFICGRRRLAAGFGVLLTWGRGGGQSPASDCA